MAKKKGQTPPRQVRMEARGRPGQIRPTVDRARAKRKANLITGGVIGVLVIAAVIAGIMTVRSGGADPDVSDGPAPWPALSDGLASRMSAADVPGPGRETFHNHVHLDVFLDGRRTPVPNGMGQSETVFAGIHTHDTEGVIHLEADEDFGPTLGDVFSIWGVRFSDTCVGAYCEPDRPIAVYVNGDEMDDFVDYELKEHDQVAVVIGDPPEEIPDTFDFDSNPTVNPSTPAPSPTASGPASPTATSPEPSPEPSPSSS